MVFGDFRLIFEVKLTPNKENSGIQFRSEVLPNGHVKGYQADIGAGWWGKLYEEEGRALLGSYAISFTLGAIFLLLVHFGPKAPPPTLLGEEAAPIDVVFNLDSVPTPTPLVPK